MGTQKGTVIEVRANGDLATYVLSTGFQWHDEPGKYEEGERVEVVPYILELVHVSRYDC